MENQIPQNVEIQNPNKSKKLQNWIVAVNVVLAVVALIGVLVFGMPEIQSIRMHKAHAKTVQDTEVMDALASEKSNLEKSVKLTSKKLDNLAPKGSYLIVNSINNEFFLYKDGELLHQGICSTGNNTLLEGQNNKKWFFKTPQGVFKIRTKVKDPLWVKPDWAFVEEGLPVPSPTHPSRYEYGVLGDYAMSIGNGYLIHGTLYKRFLGLPVTHGCIRLNDEDLKIVFDNMQLGSSVYIY
jgi:L,D-transpeptidase ErfK/SrfK